MTAAQMSEAAMDEKNAKVTVKLAAKSGYRGETVGQISARQYGEIIAIIEDGNARRKMAAAHDLLAALRWFIDDIDSTHTVMVDFDDNVERARAAIARATQTPA